MKKKCCTNNIVISICLLLLAVYCVPVKKQIIFRDKTKHSLKSIRKVDTTLFYPSFDYMLKPGDVISVGLISVTKGEYDLTAVAQQGNLTLGNLGNGGGASSGYVLNDSGFVHLPVLGSLKMSGLNLKQSEYILQEKVDRLLDNTTVSLRLLSFYVYFLGEVTNQGRIFAPRDRLTVVEAIALSGGFTDFANREYVKVIRNQNNSAHLYYIDLSDQDLITKSQVYLLPNDVIIVEPLQAKIFKLYVLGNYSLILSALSITLTLFLTLSSRLK